MGAVMSARTKSPVDRIVQKNRLASFVFGPNASRATHKQKARIVRALFPEKKDSSK